MYCLALLTFVCVVMAWTLPRSVNEGKGSLYTEVENRMEKRRQEKEKAKAKEGLDAPLLENPVHWGVCWKQGSGTRIESSAREYCRRYPSALCKTRSRR